MNYSAMIQNRRSVHAFREKEVPSEAIGQLRSYYEKTCPRLVPEIATELIVLDKDAQPALESSAGYKQFLIGAPHYLLLMSAPHSYAAINAGYMMEDLVLKLTELDIDTCWMTFTDSDKIKKALSLTTPLEVAAIVAFGYLVQQEDAYTDNLDAALDLGIVMLHFSAVASQWAGQVRWELSPAAPDGLPEGLRSAAVYHM